MKSGNAAFFRFHACFLLLDGKNTFQSSCFMIQYLEDMHVRFVDVLFRKGVTTDDGI